MEDDIQIYITRIDVPQGDSCEDIKKRKQIIKDFYALWNAAHPDKKVWNKKLFKIDWKIMPIDYENNWKSAG